MVVVDQTDAGTIKVFGGVASITTTGADAKIKQVPQVASAVSPYAFE
jgi:hypothetical protein